MREERRKRGSWDGFERRSVVLQQQIAESKLRLPQKMFQAAVELWAEKSGASIFEESVPSPRRELKDLVVSPVHKKPGEGVALCPLQYRRAGYNMVQ